MREILTGGWPGRHHGPGREGGALGGEQEVSDV